MKKRGEITVFLSLTLVCILSLFMGLLESARTAGARLYLTMAANSAMASVMNQYNRNLWDMYHLLFLEYESPEAIGRSFDTYLDFYLEQENLYPMKRKSREVTAILNMQDHAGKPLEDGILSYVRYRLPEICPGSRRAQGTLPGQETSGLYLRYAARPEGIQGGLKRPGGRWRLRWRIWSGQGYGQQRRLRMKGPEKWKRK